MRYQQLASACALTHPLMSPGGPRVSNLQGIYLPGCDFLLIDNGERERWGKAGERTTDGSDRSAKTNTPQSLRLCCVMCGISLSACYSSRPPMASLTASDNPSLV